MASTLLMANPRRRRRRRRTTSKRRRRRRSYRRNPRRRRRSGLLGRRAVAPSVLGNALPIGGGIIASVMIPKAFPDVIERQPIVKYGLQLGVGILGYMVGRPLLGSSKATMFATGAMAAMVVTILDDLVLKPKGEGILSDLPGTTIDDDTVDLISDIDGSDDPALISQDNDLLTEEDDEYYE